MKRLFKDRLVAYLESGMRVTGCHSQALLSSSLGLKFMISPYLFEACTTVPFGVAHVKLDPNRLLDSVVDPDVGLNIACDVLGVKYVYHYFDKYEDYIDATKLMIMMLNDGPVVIGPLNMGLLPYLRNYQQFLGVDHYIVVSKYDILTNELTILDPERVGSIKLLLEDLVPAWSGMNTKEGKGPYTIRQIVGLPNSINWNQCIVELAPLIHKNIDNMINEHLHHIIEFSQRTLQKNQDLALWNGINYCLKTRIRRILCSYGFISKNKSYYGTHTKDLSQLAEQSVTIAYSIINKLRIDNTVDLTQINDLIETELRFGYTLRRVT